MRLSLCAAALLSAGASTWAVAALSEPGLSVDPDARHWTAPASLYAAAKTHGHPPGTFLLGAPEPHAHGLLGRSLDYRPAAYVSGHPPGPRNRLTTHLPSSAFDWARFGVARVPSTGLLRTSAVGTASRSAAPRDTGWQVFDWRPKVSALTLPADTDNQASRNRAWLAGLRAAAPVPEPATLAFWLAGAGGAFCWRLRKTRRSG